MESRLTIKVVDLSPWPSDIVPKIHWACERIYCLDLCIPEYLLFNNEDYEELCAEIRGLHKLHNLQDDNDRIARLGVPPGRLAYTFPMPDIPRAAEHSDAHLAFAVAGFDKIPAPARGTMLVLFEDK